jgi:hypothetical protein
MPKVALADVQVEMESLLRAMEENPDLHRPHLLEMRDQLAFVLAAIKELAAEQADLQARRQSVTQQLRITRSKGQDLVIKLRGAIKSQLGHRNERLVRYHMRPIRRRTRATNEEVGIAVFPRPDLLPAVGLAPQPSGAAPASDSAATSQDAATPELEPVSPAPSGEISEEAGAPREGI